MNGALSAEKAKEVGTFAGQEIRRAALCIMQEKQLKPSSAQVIGYEMGQIIAQWMHSNYQISSNALPPGYVTAYDHKLAYIVLSCYLTAPLNKRFSKQLM